jgi:2-polyprenyl-3-methyl-5-hydroxy-6-metoxy-1,4-benzoquinol methylase
MFFLFGGKMSFDSISVDERITSGSIDELNNRFERSLDIYFDKNGELKSDVIEYINCPNCNHSKGKPFKQKRFTYIRCVACGMIYVSPRFKEEINNKIHSQERYMEHYKYKVIPSINYRKNVLASNKYKQVMKFFKKPGRVLDIGCGLGEVLSIFNDNGWDCTGVDFNPFAIDYAYKHFQLEIISENIFDFKAESEFDLIMMWGVLEHVYNPFKLLKKVNKMLKKGGLLVIEVPSSDSLLVRYCELTGQEAYRTFEAGRHLMLFSHNSIIEMFRKSGFIAEKLINNGLDIATLSRMNDIELSLEQSTKIQEVIDKTLQGDLLRGFFRKE